MPSPQARPPQTPERPLPQVLDPRTLGRPVHLLPRFTEQLGEALGELFRSQNRRYRVRYSVGAIDIKPLSSAPAQAGGRWFVGDTAGGRVACLVERGLVLSLMAQRYGADGIDSSSGTLPPETATEERLQAMLCQQLLTRALQLIDASEAPVLLPTQQPQPGAGAWVIQVEVQEATRQLSSRLQLVLDAAHINTLLKRLAEGLPQRQDLAPKPDTQQLAKRLSLKLEARLLEQVMPLGELLDLRPGDLVPVRLKSTDVLVDGARLFTASVAEHQGKLCLTSFADAD